MQKSCEFYRVCQCRFFWCFVYLELYEKVGYQAVFAMVGAYCFGVFSDLLVVILKNRECH